MTAEPYDPVTGQLLARVGAVEILDLLRPTGRHPVSTASIRSSDVTASPRCCAPKRRPTVCAWPTRRASGV